MWILYMSTWFAQTRRVTKKTRSNKRSPEGWGIKRDVLFCSLFCIQYHPWVVYLPAFVVNVSKYTIHGCYGHDGQAFVGTFCIGSLIQSFPWKSFSWVVEEQYPAPHRSSTVGTLSMMGYTTYRWAMKNNWLFRVYIGDFTTQVYREYNKPL